MSTRQSQLAQAHADLASGRIHVAQTCFEALQAQNPEDADALNGLGLCAEASQNQSAAESYYRQAIALDSEQAEFHNNLGILLQSQQRLHEALSSFSESQRLWPHANTQYNLALLNTQLGRYHEALKLTLPLMQQYPHSELPQMHCRHLLAYLYHEPQLLDQCRHLLTPHLFDGIWDLIQGTYYELHDETHAAIQFYRAALRANPHFYEAQKGLIAQLQRQGNYSQALKTARKLHDLKGRPDSLFELIGSLHQPVANSIEELLSLREELQLLTTHALQEVPATSPTSEPVIPHNLNFYHFYQGYDDRAMQEQLAQLFARFYDSTPALPVRPKTRPRLGIVSFHLYNHSVMHLLERALWNLLESEAFESCVFYLHAPPLNRQDATTEALRQRATYFKILPTHLQTAKQIIQAFAPDILIYPAVGMDSLSYLLALNRLAPCQMVLPGHPVTTGMRNMDYFISSQILEVPEAQIHYSEKLIRLPGLPDYKAPPAVTPATHKDLGLPTGNLYFCPMTIFKVHPDFDQMILQILTQDPQAQVLFLQFKNQLHLSLQARLQNSLSSEQSERLHFISWSKPTLFYQRLQACDVILDTFYFGGGNTAYQAFGLNCPIVTLNVPWNKGRWTQAMYRLMGIKGLVAESPEEYARIAVRVATDKQWQSVLRQQIAEHKAVLFDKPDWSEALLDFCLEQVSKMQTAPGLARGSCSTKPV